MELSVKLCVTLLVSGLLLAASQSRYAGGLSDDPGKPFNGKNQVKFTANLLGTSNPSVSSDDEPAQTKSKFVTIEGTRLHFAIKGAGRPVVLIHGNPGSSQDWVRVFSVLAAHHKIIAFDRPGHGRSQRPKHEEATVEVQARLLHDALRQLSVQRPILIGHSWGGALALVYAINYPKEVAGLVLVAPAVYESQDGVSFLTKLPAVPVIGDAVNFVLTPLFGASVVRKDLKKAFSPDPVPKNYLRSVLSEWTRPKKVKAYALDDALLSDCLKKFSPRYSEIEVPLSILAGDSDLIVPEKENAERLHKALPKSQFVLLRQTGHEIPFTRPQAVIDALHQVESLP
ncbi:MAG TPA: alpha/beta hydrolase [Pyrinomonadaceae bacterium]|nr:alpha/beta hydrolase [Pyrinomonadaceae bacterium]